MKVLGVCTEQSVDNNVVATLCCQHQSCLSFMVMRISVSLVGEQDTKDLRAAEIFAASKRAVVPYSF